MHKRDWLLVALILALAACFALLWPKFQGGQGQSIEHVEARRDGALVFEKAFSELGDYEILGTAGEANTLRIEANGVRMVHANCPDQFCVEQGLMQNSTETIVCLPHRLVIRLVPEKEKEEAQDARTPEAPDVIAR